MNVWKKQDQWHTSAQKELVLYSSILYLFKGLISDSDAFLLVLKEEDLY